MTDDGLNPPIRLMNFVSEKQLEESKKTRGPRVEDGTAQRDRPLFEILRENKDKKDAEFNERFKHRPPKALDEDETEFLDNLEMSRREYEQIVANEEAQQLRNFQEQVAAQTAILQELKETPMVPPKPQEPPPSVEKKTRPRSLGVVIKVKPQAKKAKMGVPEHTISEESKAMLRKPDPASISTTDTKTTLGGLVSYSDESDDE